MIMVSSLHHALANTQMHKITEFIFCKQDCCVKLCWLNLSLFFISKEKGIECYCSYFFSVLISVGLNEGELIQNRNSKL